MSREELIAKGVQCLIENLGYIEAGEFLEEIADNNNEYDDYTEWRRENLFKGMKDEEIIENAIKYSMTNNI